MNNFLSHRIPTTLAFFLLIVGTGVTAYLTVIGIIPFGHAAPGENPQEIRVSNITDTSFTITYRTDALVIGSVSIGTDRNFGQVALDDRDQPTGTLTQHSIHSITVRNLKPSTKYLYAITSGLTTYLNRDSPFIISTGPKIATSPSTEIPIAGNIQLSSGDKATEGIVYVTAQHAQTLSTLVKPNGLYIIPLNGLRTDDFTSYITFTNKSTLQLLVIGDSEKSQVSLFANQRSPTPLITLSNNYDFTLRTTPLVQTSTLPIGFPAFSVDTSVQAEPKIETPVQNEKFTDPQPLLRGKAIPNGVVQIEIHSLETISKTVTANQFGNWVYRPDTPLAPGSHTITITTKDQFGILNTLRQTFTIFASGTQVAEAATPSATPSFTPTNSPTPTIPPTLSPTPTLSLTPSPTLSPTLSPTPSSTPSPTLSVTLTPVPTQKLPPTGNNTLVTIGTVTLVTTVTGVVLFLLSLGVHL